MLIYLLRHGLTAYNAEKRYQGQRDIPLSPEGRAQLRRANRMMYTESVLALALGLGLRALL